LLSLSKRATSLISVTRAGDLAILNRVWTSEVAHEHIVVEIQLVCETEKQTKRIFMRALCEER
jgi:hypothetical protein